MEDDRSLEFEISCALDHQSTLMAATGDAGIQFNAIGATPNQTGSAPRRGSLRKGDIASNGKNRLRVRRWPSTKYG
jgi:hypothetical protein